MDLLCKVDMDIDLDNDLSRYDLVDRGSSGEGIWITKLKAGNSCSMYGERSCEDVEVLDLMEANGIHAVEHTAAEFLEFCMTDPIGHGAQREVQLRHSVHVRVQSGRPWILGLTAPAGLGGNPRRSWITLASCRATCSS